MSQTELKCSTKNKLAYGCGSVSYSVISQTIANFFMFYGTSVVGISGTLVGVAIAISTIWDAVTDTFVGYYSDKHTFLNMGHRNGYILVACIGMAICNIFVWTIPINISMSLKFIWALVSLLLVESFNTIFCTPYLALSSDIICQYHERTSLQVYKTIFYLIGIIIPSVLLFVFLPNTAEYPVGQLNPFGYKQIAIVTSAICLIFGFICVFGTLKKSKCSSPTVLSTPKMDIKQLFSQFFGCYKDENLRKLIFGCSMTMVATTFLTSVGLHFFTFCFFYNSTKLTILLLTLMLGTIFSQPFWLHLSKKYDKKYTVLISIYCVVSSVFLVILSYILRVQIYKYSFYINLFAIFTAGVGSGALYTIPNSMYSDVIGILNNKCGENRSALYSGVLTFSTNFINAFSLFIIGLMLDMIKFDGNSEIQTLSVQTGLALILFLGLQTSLIISIIIFSKYKITKKDVK